MIDLGVECSRGEAVSLVRHFKACVSQGGGSGDIGDQRSFVVEVSHAEDDRGPGFLRQSKINQPDLAALYFRSCHCSPSPSSASSIANTSAEALMVA